MTAIRTIVMLGGPRDGTRTLAAGAVGLLSSNDLFDRCHIIGHDDDGSTYEYAILGSLENGELLAVPC